MRKITIGVVSLLAVLMIAGTTLSFGGNTGMTSNFWKVSSGDLVPTTSNEKVKVYDLEITNAFTLSGTAAEGIALAEDKYMSGGTALHNLGESGIVRLQWTSDANGGTGKPAVVWFDHNGDRQAAIVAHYWSVNEGAAHQHWSVETSKDDGGLYTRLAIGWGANRVLTKLSDSDFLIKESNDLFWVDTNGNRVGILNGSPDTVLHVNGDTTVSKDDTQAKFYLRRKDTTISNGNDLGRLDFTADDASAVNTAGARILGEADGDWASGDTPGRLSFWTTTDGTETLSERMTIKNDGDVGINTIDPATTLDVNGGIRADFKTADPCGAGFPEGVLFYNDTSDYYCFCDGAGVDKKVSDNGACF